MKSYYLGVADVIITNVNEKGEEQKYRTSMIQLIFASTNASAKDAFQNHIEELNTEKSKHEVVSIYVDPPLEAL